MARAVLLAAATAAALGWGGPEATPRVTVTAPGAVALGARWAITIRVAAATARPVRVRLAGPGRSRALRAHRVAARTFAVRTSFATAGRWTYSVLVGGRRAAGGTVVVRPAAVRPRNPYGVDVDAAGNVFVADGESHRVLRWDATRRRLAVIAGTGVAGTSGDGGPATRARIGVPTGLAVDADGSVYVADFTENRIRRVDPQGVITTVAGTGRRGAGGDGGPAVAADLGLPADVALDRARRVLYVTTLESRVRAVDLRSGTISTVAGDGVEAVTGDGGPAAAARVQTPHGIEVDAAGNVLLSDFRALRRIDAATGVITTLAALETHKTHAASDGSIFYVWGNPSGGAVHRIAAAGTGTRVAGTGALDVHRDGGPATEAGLLPSDAVLAPDGALLVAQTQPVPAVRRVDLASGVITTLFR
jgi:sugar lactone lactonase YvrE